MLTLTVAFIHSAHFNCMPNGVYTAFGKQGLQQWARLTRFLTSGSTQFTERYRLAERQLEEPEIKANRGVSKR